MYGNGLAKVKKTMNEELTRDMLWNREKLWSLVDQYVESNEESIINSLAQHLKFTFCKHRYSAKDFDIYKSLAMAIKEMIIEYWNDSQQAFYGADPKMVYYLSLEFLVGKSLKNNLINLGIYEVCKSAVEKIGYSLETLEDFEPDAGLGNGGLGRLAACFMDSLATLNLPAVGYGIRYEYGIFRQEIENGKQVEYPDNWIEDGCYWEIPQWDIMYPVYFYGQTKYIVNENGDVKYSWDPGQKVLAMAYDFPIVGYKNKNINTLRLWSAKSSKEFDFSLFDGGNYIDAVDDKIRTENISKVLYPNDNSEQGKILRLKQQYFFSSASLQDIIGTYKSKHENFDNFSKKVAIQLNDTHPVISIPELMRILMDVENLSWDKAWEITTKVFAYTNHTVLPEALEKWPVAMLENLLPRHMDIIYEINHRFINEIKNKINDNSAIERMSIIEEGHIKSVRMANLAVITCFSTNGVAALHSELLKDYIFNDFYVLFPERFQNKTNGITPRRFLKSSNPQLSELITEKIGEDWVTNLDNLTNLKKFAKDKNFQKKWREIKDNAKQKLAVIIKNQNGIDVNLNSIFDIQVKRIHEYKRQLLNILYCITLYNRIKDNPQLDMVPRTMIMGGKSAPGYYMAKKIISLFNDIGRVVNNDSDVGDKLKIVFLKNFCVSLGEKVYPAAELSEQISTAGMEASGTGNMKFMLNGAITIGTLDGANVEINEEVGNDNIFIFGLTTEEVYNLRNSGYNPVDYHSKSKELTKVLETLRTGIFNSEGSGQYDDIINELSYNDYYMLCADYDKYIAAQDKASNCYKNQSKWIEMSINNTASAGKFSSDRTISQYAEEIWDVRQLELESRR